MCGVGIASVAAEDLGDVMICWDIDAGMTTSKKRRFGGQKLGMMDFMFVAIKEGIMIGNGWDN